MGKRRVKSQITVFIVLGIIILIIILMMLSSRNTLLQAKLKEKPEAIASEIFEKSALKKHITTCLDDVSKDALLRAAEQGGIYFPKTKTSQGQEPPQPGNSFEATVFEPMLENRDFLTSNGISTYYSIAAANPSFIQDAPFYPCRKEGTCYPFSRSYTKENPFGANFTWGSPSGVVQDLIDKNNQQDMLLLPLETSSYTYGYSIEEQMERYIDVNLVRCVNLSLLDEILQYEIIPGPAKTDVQFGREEVVFDVVFPIKVNIYGDENTVLVSRDERRFTSQHKARFKPLYLLLQIALGSDYENVTFPLQDLDPLAQFGTQFAFFTTGFFRDVNDDRDDLFIVRDETALKGEGLSFNAAIKNRRPALEDYYTPPSSVSSRYADYDIVTGINRILHITPFALDADERPDEGLIYTYHNEDPWLGAQLQGLSGGDQGPSWMDFLEYKTGSASYTLGTRIFTADCQSMFDRNRTFPERCSSYFTQPEDEGSHNVTITVYDNAGLSDYYVLHILIKRKAEIKLSGKNPYPDVSDKYASVEDPYCYTVYDADPTRPSVFAGDFILLSDAYLTKDKDGNIIQSIFEKPLSPYELLVDTSQSYTICNPVDEKNLSKEDIIRKYPGTWAIRYPYYDNDGKRLTVTDDVQKSHTATVEMPNCYGPDDCDESSFAFYDYKAFLCLPHESNAAPYPYNNEQFLAESGRIKKYDKQGSATIHYLTGITDDPFQGTHSCCTETEVMGGNSTVKEPRLRTSSALCYGFEETSCGIVQDLSVLGIYQQYYPGMDIPSENSPVRQGKKIIGGAPTAYPLYPATLLVEKAIPTVLGVPFAPGDLIPKLSTTLEPLYYALLSPNNRQLANDLFLRTYRQFCSGERGNVCNGNVEDAWEIQQSCGRCDACALPSTENGQGNSCIPLKPMDGQFYPVSSLKKEDAPSCGQGLSKDILSMPMCNGGSNAAYRLTENDLTKDTKPLFWQDKGVYFVDDGATLGEGEGLLFSGGSEAVETQLSINYQKSPSEIKKLLVAANCNYYDFAIAGNHAMYETARQSNDDGIDYTRDRYAIKTAWQIFADHNTYALADIPSDVCFLNDETCADADCGPKSTQNYPAAISCQHILGPDVYYGVDNDDDRTWYGSAGDKGIVNTVSDTCTWTDYGINQTSCIANNAYADFSSSPFGCDPNTIEGRKKCCGVLNEADSAGLDLHDDSDTVYCNDFDIYPGTDNPTTAEVDESDGRWIADFESEFSSCTFGSSGKASCFGEAKRCDIATECRYFKRDLMDEDARYDDVVKEGEDDYLCYMPDSNDPYSPGVPMRWSMLPYGADLGAEDSCSDSYDNDCDGLTDCQDPDCFAKSCNTGEETGICTTDDGCSDGESVCMLDGNDDGLFSDPQEDTIYLISRHKKECESVQCTATPQEPLTDASVKGLSFNGMCCEGYAANSNPSSPPNECWTGFTQCSSQSYVRANVDYVGVEQKTRPQGDAINAWDPSGKFRCDMPLQGQPPAKPVAYVSCDLAKGLQLFTTDANGGGNSRCEYGCSSDASCDEKSQGYSGMKDDGSIQICSDKCRFTTCSLPYNYDPLKNKCFGPKGSSGDTLPVTKQGGDSQCNVLKGYQLSIDGEKCVLCPDELCSKDCQADVAPQCEGRLKSSDFSDLSPIIGKNKGCDSLCAYSECENSQNKFTYFTLGSGGFCTTPPSQTEDCSYPRLSDDMPYFYRYHSPNPTIDRCVKCSKTSLGEQQPDGSLLCFAVCGAEQGCDEQLAGSPLCNDDCTLR